MAKSTAHQRRYKVTLKIEGEAQRMVVAASEQEAVALAKKMLLEADGQTPKKNALPAFCWDMDHEWAFPHWSDLLPGEREDRIRKATSNLDKNDETTEGEHHEEN